MSSCACPAPAKRVWPGLRARLGLRPCRAGGLRRLRKEVRTCDYGDVHVMWDMLCGAGTGTGSGGVRDGRRRRLGSNCGAIGLGRVGTKLAAWSRLASYCCAL